MTPKQAEKRLDELEVEEHDRREDVTYWQERLELLRVIDRASAPTSPATEDGP